MPSEPPSLIAIDHDDYYANRVGTTKEGIQFLVTTPFVPGGIPRHQRHRPLVKVKKTVATRHLYPQCSVKVSLDEIFCLHAGSTTVSSLFTVFAYPEAAFEKEADRIQNGLLPAAFVKGNPIRKMSLADRMFVYHATGVSIAIIHNGAIRWAQGFGTLKLSAGSVTAETLFQAASISKPVTAFAALRLAQSGKLDLNEDVNHYLKSWKVPTNSFTEQHRVTLLELLTHTAGATISEFSVYAAGTAIPTLRQILDGVPLTRTSIWPPWPSEARR